jgi:hypothetical protein
MVTLNKIAVGIAGNGVSGIYSKDQVHCPKHTLFNLQGHISLLQGHKVCQKHAILMPAPYKMCGS